jgi:hypothetical protein
MSLRQLNLSAAILHYTLAIGFSVYFNRVNKKYGNKKIRGIELSNRDHKLVLTDIQPGNCVQSTKEEEKNGHNTICNDDGSGVSADWISYETGVLDVKVIQGLLIAFFIITGTFHLFYYIGNAEKSGPKTTLNNFYSNAIKNENNFYRWIEYSITATMMLYVIAYTSGVKDTNIYLMLFATNVTLISLGQTVEVAVRDGKSWWLPMLTSFLLLISEFAVIMRSFWRRLDEVNTYIKLPNHPVENKIENAKIPSWLNIMIVLLFVFFSCFGGVALYGAYNHTSYDKIEKAYIILSFVSKAVLASFVAYGTAQRQTSAE